VPKGELLLCQLSSGSAMAKYGTRIRRLKTVKQDINTLFALTDSSM
jgi:hypothetical protein